MNTHATMRWRRGVTLAALALFGVPGCLPADQTRDVDPGVGALRIDAVRGNSERSPEFLEAHSLFRDALVVEGQGLDRVDVASLQGEGTTPTFAPLELGAKSPTSLHVLLPRELVEGSYRLVISAGEETDSAALVLLRGVAGPPGQGAPEWAVSWEVLLAPLPPLEALVARDDAVDRYASVQAAIDLSEYATKAQLDGMAKDADLAPFARRAELPAPWQQGFPTAEALAEVLARQDELPDPEGAVLRADLPDYDSYVTSQVAAAQGVALGHVAANHYTTDEVMAQFTNTTAGFGPAQWAEIDAWIDAGEAALPLPSCAASEVKVGSACVDRYEARVGLGAGCDDPGVTWLGQTGQDYPSWLGVDGSIAQAPPGASLVACSQPGGAPSAWINWFQAQTLCRARGARLCRNEEWQVAAAGTDDSAAGGCTLAGAGPGSAPGSCLSGVGGADLVGSLAEWTGDWIAGGPGYHYLTQPSGLPSLLPKGPAPWATLPTSMGTVNHWNGSGFLGDEAVWEDLLPTALVRGGHFESGDLGGAHAVDATRLPLATSDKVGFRCCRDL